MRGRELLKEGLAWTISNGMGEGFNSGWIGGLETKPSYCTPKESLLRKTERRMSPTIKTNGWD